MYMNVKYSDFSSTVLIQVVKNSVKCLHVCIFNCAVDSVMQFACQAVGAEIIFRRIIVLSISWRVSYVVVMDFFIFLSNTVRAQCRFENELPPGADILHTRNQWTVEPRGFLACIL